MAALSILKKLNKLISTKSLINTNLSINIRQLSYSAKIYGFSDGNPNPGPVFIRNEIQILLKQLTRVDPNRVFYKRKLGTKTLKQPTYKFMTDSELKEALDEAHRKIDEFIQMPPIVTCRKSIDRVLSDDSHLQGLDESKFVFTDITYGVSDSKRLIVVRDTDGKLKEADWDLRDRMNQTYFPQQNRSLKMPRMFSELNYLEDVLNRREYKFVLDRACLQFDPNDGKYQEIVSITYQHINEHNQFDSLRSTRHFGCLTFFLVWHKMIDNLLLELIETDHIDEVNLLIELYARIHQIELRSIEDYIEKHAVKKGALELAVQAYKDLTRRRETLRNN